MAVADGIRIMLATPHLFKNRVVDPRAVNNKKMVLRQLEEFKGKLAAEGIALQILPGCDFPLSFEALNLLEADQVLTINDAKRYLLLELPDTVIPPAIGNVCFRLQAWGITPIITHPERHLVFQDMPDKLKDLLDLGCLVQLTAGSLTGMFGRRVAKVARQMVKKGYVHVLASDAHSTRGRPPLMSHAVKKLAKLIGHERAQAMVTHIPEKIINGEPVL